MWRLSSPHPRPSPWRERESEVSHKDTKGQRLGIAMDSWYQVAINLVQAPGVVRVATLHISRC